MIVHAIWNIRTNTTKIKTVHGSALTNTKNARIGNLRVFIHAKHIVEKKGAEE